MCLIVGCINKWFNDWFFFKWLVVEILYIVYLRLVFEVGGIFFVCVKEKFFGGGGFREKKIFLFFY